MTGRPQSTIRDWMRKGLIQGERDEKGRWLLNRVTVITAATTAPTAARTVKAQLQQRASTAPTTDVSIVANSTNEKYIESLHETVLREREENKELRTRIRELEQERTQHMAEMRALLSKDISGKDGILSRWIRK